MAQNNFKKTRLAAAVALVSSTVFMTGCVDGDSTTSTSTTQAADRIVISQQKTQKAQVVGIVQDTNGNPIANATVSIGVRTVKTNSNGAYYLQDIPVSGLNNIVNNNNTATPLEISIVTPEGEKNYLSATVSVTPSASTIIQTQGGDDTNTEDSLIALVQQDGLAVSAGVTVVPEIKSTVVGVLLNEETGEPVANAVIGLDVLGVNGVAQQQRQNNGAGTSYGVATYQAATNDAGEFEFTNLPVDTEFNINIDNWTNVAAINSGNRGAPFLGGQFDTTPEATKQNIGDIEAKFISSVDNVDPFVLSVSEVRVNGGTGLLKNGIDGTQGLTINFSEPVTADNLLDAIYIKNNTVNEDVISVANATLSTDGKTLVITTAAAIAEGVEFSVYLNQVDFKDSAGNTIEAGPATFNDKTIAQYDANSAAVAGLSTIELTLKTYSKPILETGAAVNLMQLQQDGLTSDFAMLQTLNSTFADIDSGSLRGNDQDIEQLNSKDAEGRLTTLAAATYAAVGLAGNPAVDSTTARIQFSLDATTPSRNYVLELKNSNGTSKTLTVAESSAEVTIASNNSQQVEVEIDDAFNGQVDFIIQDSNGDLEHGDMVVIASVNDFGVVVAQTQITLEDKIAPTTVIQSNYGLGDATSSVLSPNYGDGGELAANGTASLGTPLLNVTAGLLTPQVGNAALPLDDTWDALTDEVETDDANNAQVSDAGLAGYALYDATAFTAWDGSATARTRNVGIAFSENVTLAANPAYDGDATLLSEWAAQNDVTVNSQNGVVSVDLVNVKVADVIKLANDNHNSVIDFSDDIADVNGNTATAANNPKVVVRDRMPPLPTSAVYTGDTIVVTFNEDLGELTGDSEVQLENLTIGALDTDNFASVAGSTLTINSQAWGVQLANLNAFFARGTYDHDGLPATPDARHGALTVDGIADVRENSWDNSSIAGIDKPAIVIRDDVGEFELSTGTSGFAAGSTQVTLTFNFTHRINLQDLGAASAEAIELDAAETAALFNLTSAASIVSTGTDTGATLSNSGKTLTITLQTDAALTAGDVLAAVANPVNSAWDANATAFASLINGNLTVN